MADTHEIFKFTVRSYECAPDGCLTLANLCNYLQEAASVNAGHLGFSKTDFNAAGKDITWVLTRMHVKIATYPKWGDDAFVTTFPRIGRRITAYRDFIVHDANGGELARATTEWMVIDMASRRPLPIPDFVFASANDVREPVLGERMEPLPKLSPENFSQTFATRALKSDMDLNRHVNNVRYITWILESLPDDAPPVSEISLAFRSEALAGDEVTGHTNAASPSETFVRLVSASGSEITTALVRF
ncbi:MAG: hypothetical protein IJ802_02960 [Kiritimatiellae bacterium]|nr:hypothetical protein [Kiritimatiellia bacterium]